RSEKTVQPTLDIPCSHLLKMTIRASAGMACCFLENHSHIARLKQPSFENHENAVSRGWQLAQSRAVAGYRIS
ncbi:hypothetical protein ACJ0PQ_24870, partial [Citrobacter cronae]|uniref:hypothetical protein n=1 Tax=Citrobacter cronae TaxID=1748967 RepID=UPI0038883D2D